MAENTQEQQQAEQNVQETQAQPAAANTQQANAGSGLDGNMAALFAWIGQIIPLGIIVPVILLLIDKDKPHVRYHAIQSIAFGVLLYLVSVVVFFLSLVTLGLGTCLYLPVFGYGLVVMVMGAIKASNGEKFGDFLIGNWVEKQFINK